MAGSATGATNRQLVLPLAPGGSRFESFVASGANRMTVAAVQAFAAGGIDEPQLFLHGVSGSGKSHLLSAACERARADGHRIAYVNCADRVEASAFDGLETNGLNAIDRLEALDDHCEEALFHAINRCRSANARLLFAARVAPGGLDHTLPDLATRLHWGPVFQLHRVDDESMTDALEQLFRSRGIPVGREVLAYLLSRCSRDMATLTHLVDRLDTLSLQQQRAVTVPLVRQLVDPAVA